MFETLERGLGERRSLAEAHADLIASYKKHPSPALARMIEQIEAEIAARKAATDSGQLST